MTHFFAAQADIALSAGTHSSGAFNRMSHLAVLLRLVLLQG